MLNQVPATSDRPGGGMDGTRGPGRPPGADAAPDQAFPGLMQTVGAGGSPDPAGRGDALVALLNLSSLLGYAGFTRAVVSPEGVGPQPFGGREPAPSSPRESRQMDHTSLARLAASQSERPVRTFEAPSAGPAVPARAPGAPDVRGPDLPHKAGPGAGAPSGPADEPAAAAIQAVGEAASEPPGTAGLLAGRGLAAQNLLKLQADSGRSGLADGGRSGLAEGRQPAAASGAAAGLDEPGLPVQPTLGGAGRTFATALKQPAAPLPDAALQEPAAEDSPQYAGLPSIRVELDPEDFGSIRLHVALADRTVYANLVTDHAGLRDYLLRNQDHLESGLGAQGLDIGGFLVTTGQQDPGGQASGGRLAEDPGSTGEHGGARRPERGVPESPALSGDVRWPRSGLNLFA